MIQPYPDLPPRPMTRKEAAEYQRCTTRTIDRRIASGELKAVRIGRTVLLDAHDVVSKVSPTA
jgi:excisionase family DNA binding protein